MAKRTDDKKPAPRTDLELVVEEARRPHRPIAALCPDPTLPADGIARDYAQLVALLVAIRHEIGLTGEALDDVVGWQERYTSKLEQPGTLYGRSAVNPSFDLWL